MVWYQLKIESCPEDKAEEISNFLDETGALSVMFTDKNDCPVLEPEPGTTPLWPELIIHALFAQATEAELARKQLKDSYPTLQYSLETLPDKDWERAWMDDFKPQRYGKRLWICPTHATLPEDPEAIHLLLDPGLAFGTGSHPTTSLCLSWLDQANLNNKTLIDYGCGSGILALAALKLGAEKVFAVDIDDQALQAIHNNAKTNLMPEDKLSISQPDLLHEHADILIANILLTPLISLKNRFFELLNTKGILVISGLLEEQAPQLIADYHSTFSLIHQENLDGWSLLVFIKEG